MHLIRRSPMLAALRLPYPEGGNGGGGSPPAPPPPPPPQDKGPLGALGNDGQETEAELLAWKPEKDTDFDQRTLPKDLRDKDPQKVIANLAKVNKGFRDKQAQQEAPPEKSDGYTFETPAALKEHFPDLANDQAFKALQEGLHEAGLGQTAFTKATTKILSKLAETGVIAKPVTLAEEAKKLGGEDKARERHRATSAFVQTAIANKVFDAGDGNAGRTERLKGALEAMPSYAEGVEILELLMSGRQERGPGGGGAGSGGGITAADIAERRKDPRYLSTSASYDINFRRETDNLARQLAGGK